MEIKNHKPVSGSEPRRFSAGRTAPQASAKSFASALGKAVAGSPAADSVSGPSATPPPGEGGAAQPAAPGPQPPAEANAPAAANPPTDPDAAFADHMEMVRFRLKTGYYASKAIDDALTDKLSGYFDELA